MLEFLKENLEKYPGDRLIKVHYLREHLQLLVLKFLDEQGYFRNLAFVGGTALHIIYDLRRFSEDLDFCLTNPKKYNFSILLKRLEKYLQQNNLKISMTVNDQKTVASAFIKFEKLLPALGLSPHDSQKLSIKIEVDKKPPTGFKTDFSMINKGYLIGIQHYDLPSLFSGKLHAVLFRSYTKGRDFYDWLWFIGKKVEPNLVLLKHAIFQTEGKRLALDKAMLRSLLREKVHSIDFKKIRQDVLPFLMDSHELRFFEKDIFLKLSQL